MQILYRFLSEYRQKLLSLTVWMSNVVIRCQHFLTDTFYLHFGCVSAVNIETSKHAYEFVWLSKWARNISDIEPSSNFFVSPHLPQWVHWNGFSPLWMRMCSFKWCLNLNAFPHSGHLKRLNLHSAVRLNCPFDATFGPIVPLSSIPFACPGVGDRTARWMLVTCSSNARRPLGPRNSLPQWAQRDTSSNSV